MLNNPERENRIMIRRPAVAGYFYPRDPRELRAFLERAVEGREWGEAGVAPHAGYVYSGKLAARVHGDLKRSERVVVVGPNHTGLGSPLSVFPGEGWETPLGILKNDVDSVELLERCGAVRDYLAHMEEHSIEVQLPFIQVKNPGARVAGLVMALQDIRVAEKIGRCLAGEEIVLVASSDFSHYVPEEVARKYDLEALELIAEKKIREFYDFVLENSLSICGYGPIMVAMAFAKERGLRGEIVGYMTSGDVTGDRGAVVGYGGVVFG